MLVIRRGRGESVFIGDNVEVEILDIGAHQVKIGIRAPKQVPVLRSEILLASEANRASSCGVSPEGVAELVERLQARSRAR